MLYKYRYYNDDNQKGKFDSRVDARMKIYDCGPDASGECCGCFLDSCCPCGCTEISSTKAQPRLPRLKGLPGVSGRPALPGFIGHEPPGLPGAPWPAGLPALPILAGPINYWSDDYYRHINTQ